MTTTSSKPAPRLSIRDLPACIALIRQHGLRPSELQQALDVSQAWVTRGRANGRHDLAAVVAWARQRDRERAPLESSSSSDGSESSPELERFRRARADLLEIDLGQRRGELVERREVVDFAATSIQAVRQRLDDLVRKMSVRLFQGPSIEWIEAQLRTEVDALCRGFAAGINRTHAARDDGEDEQPDKTGTLPVDDDQTESPAGAGSR